MRKKYQRLLEVMIKLFNTYVPENISNICESVFNSGEIASGSYVNKLEAKFQSMLGRSCISVNNSSNALHLILDALNLKISDKDGGMLDVVEVFKTDGSGKVEEIWAL